jgi:hypothetical protein
MQCRLVILLALLAVSWLTPRDGEGAIHVYWPETPIQRPLNWEFELDLDFNGIADLVFHSNPSSYWLRNINDSAILSYEAGPMDANSFIIPLRLGDYIGPDLDDPAIWHDTDGSAVFVSCMSVGPGNILCIGLWPPEGDIGYFGLQFYIDDNIHYGWVQMDFSEFGTVGGNIVGWAYESTPNAPIFAGAIPEPSTLSLLFSGGIALFAYKRRFRNIR